MVVKQRLEGRSPGHCRVGRDEVVSGESEGPPDGAASRHAPRKSRQGVRATFSRFSPLSRSVGMAPLPRTSSFRSKGVHSLCVVPHADTPGSSIAASTSERVRASGGRR